MRHISCDKTGALVLFGIWFLVTSSGMSLELVLGPEDLQRHVARPSKPVCQCGHDGACMADCNCSVQTERQADDHPVLSCNTTPASHVLLSKIRSLQWKWLSPEDTLQSIQSEFSVKRTVLRPDSPLIPPPDHVPRRI